MRKKNNIAHKLGELCKCRKCFWIFTILLILTTILALYTNDISSLTIVSLTVKKTILTIITIAYFISACYFSYIQILDSPDTFAQVIKNIKKARMWIFIILGMLGFSIFVSFQTSDPLSFTSLTGALRIINMIATTVPVVITIRVVGVKLGYITEKSISASEFIKQYHCD